MSYFKWSQQITEMLLKEEEYDSEKREIVNYAVEVLGIHLVNLTAVFLLAAVLGVWRETLLLTFCAVLYRHSAGGSHSQSAVRCGIVSILIFPALGFMAVLLAEAWSGLSGFWFSWLAGTIFLGAGMILYRYSPHADPKAPIVTKNRRLRLRKLSLLFFLLLVLLFLFLKQYPSYQVSILLVVLWLSFNLTPLAESFWRKIDML